MGWVQPAYGGLNFPAKGITYSYPSFFLNTQSCDPSGWLTCSGWPPRQNFTSTYCLPDPDIAEPHTYSVRALGKEREARRNCPTSLGRDLFPFTLTFLPDGERVRVPLTLAKLPSTAFLSGTEGCDSTSLFSLTVPDTPQPFHFLFRMKKTRTNSHSFSSATQRHVHKLLWVAEQAGISIFCCWSSRTQFKEEKRSCTPLCNRPKPLQDINWKTSTLQLLAVSFPREVLPKCQVGLYIQPRLVLEALRGETISHSSSIERSAHQLLIWLALITLTEIIVWHSAMSPF